MLNDGRIMLKTLVVLSFYLAAADLIGVVACFLFDVAPLRFDSGASPYAIWSVLGIFTGFIVFGAAGHWASRAGKGEWSGRLGAARTGNLVLATGLAGMAGLGLLFDRLWWSRGVDGEYFVPDSAPHTITFFGSTALAMLIGRHVAVDERTW
ncbi:hypothetical protein [Sphingosinicella sp. CPCC 101087]|uniref:hypothetical protein n=1 Tax=Sphingosinicella sp. CPCC 101087 TaxID=2497754 RepID=UPI00101CE950|nr:hypothetical protein [Sphingosinicella sp. CPCC 101087]